MKNIFYGFLLSMLLGSCATTSGYEKVLQTWVGLNVNELLQSWGPPADVYKLPNGSMMYTWWFDGGVVSMPIGKRGGAMTMNRYCKTTFTVNEQGVIQRWSWKGNTCKK